jgi:hypothetical protein
MARKCDRAARRSTRHLDLFGVRRINIYVNVDPYDFFSKGLIRWKKNPIFSLYKLIYRILFVYFVSTNRMVLVKINLIPI